MATSIDKSAETATVAATIEVSKEAKACKNNRLIVFLKTEVMGYLLTCLLTCANCIFHTSCWIFAQEFLVRGSWW
jgi:hypothetical protein